MTEIPYRPEDFYATYGEYKTYVLPEIRKKHIRDFTEFFWNPCKFNSEMSVLEIGCGTGIFMKYMENAGIQKLTGVDSDPEVLKFIPDSLKSNIEIIDVNEYLSDLEDSKQFDRVVMIDVLEHFNPAEGANLLERIKPFLKENGGVVVRVPNVASPWGQAYQHGDLTHKAAYTSGSLRQLGVKAGYNCRVFESRRGNPRKRMIENLFHKFVRMVVTEPPEFWSANIIGFFEPVSRT
jgi:SAM-dependent methyltransferase